MVTDMRFRGSQSGESSTLLYTTAHPHYRNGTLSELISYRTAAATALAATAAPSPANVSPIKSAFTPQQYRSETQDTAKIHRKNVRRWVGGWMGTLSTGLPSLPLPTQPVHYYCKAVRPVGHMCGENCSQTTVTLSHCHTRGIRTSRG